MSKDIQAAFLPGVVSNNAGDISWMEQELHDALIDMVGTRRRSGIRWRHVHGRAAAIAMLHKMYDDDPDRWKLVEDHYLPALTRLGDDAVMVIADCDALPPSDGDRA